MTTDHRKLTRLSKLLSLILRHKPQAYGVELDAEGWADVAHLLHQLQAHGVSMHLTLLEEIVSTNSKKRFAFSEDRKKIRASQGHSIPVELGYTPVEPPGILYHGTAEKAVDSIRVHGLEKRSRHHVHLSADEATARMVGQRHGKPVIFRVWANRMFQAGFNFYQSENGVWLTDQVPPEYMELIANNGEA